MMSSFLSPDSVLSLPVLSNGTSVVLLSVFPLTALIVLFYPPIHHIAFPDSLMSFDTLLSSYGSSAYSASAQI